MESILSWIHPLWALALPIAASVPIGLWMARVLDPPADRAGRGLDAVPLGLWRLLGRREPAAMDWKRYAIALLAFNVALFVLYLQPAVCAAVPAPEPRRQGVAGGHGIQGRRRSRSPGRRSGCGLQHRLLVRDQHQPPALLGRAAPVVFQPARRDRLAPVRDARGRPLRDAGRHPRPARRQAPRRFLRRPDADPGLCLRAPGPDRRALVRGHRDADDVPGGGQGDDPARRAEQTIARGPVAALVAIKQLGTNGGGFFGPNCAHPYENPTPWSNLLAIFSIVLLPMSSLVMFGRMLKDRGMPWWSTG